MARRGPGSADRHGLHLLEVGVQWPPETFLRRKLEGLAARGLRVTVASNMINDDRFALRGVELLPMPGGRSSSRSALVAGLGLAVRSPATLVRLVRNVKRVPPPLRRRHGGSTGLLSMCLPLARLRPDVVQFEWNIAAVDHLPLFDIWDCPVVTSCRGSDLTVYPHLPGLRSYAEHLPEVMRRAKAVHCVAESLTVEAVGFGMDPAKAWVIRPAVDPEVFHPGDAVQKRRERPRRGQVLRLLAVGEMRWEKGHEYGLQAVRALLDRGVPVRYEVLGAAPDERCGPTPEQQRIHHTVADLGLERHVSLLRRGPAMEVRERLVRTDVFLHSSLAEGIPNAVVEAMACAVPVVSTDCGGVSEAITTGIEGYVVPARDPEQLASALMALWRDSELRTRMGEAGRARVCSEFTLAAQIDAFLAMYRDVVA